MKKISKLLDNGFYTYENPYKRCITCNKYLKPKRFAKQIKNCCFISAVGYYGFHEIVSRYISNNLWTLTNLFKHVYAQNLSSLIPQGVKLLNTIKDNNNLSSNMYNDSVIINPGVTDDAK